MVSCVTTICTTKILKKRSMEDTPIRRTNVESSKRYDGDSKRVVLIKRITIKNHLLKILLSGTFRRARQPGGTTKINFVCNNNGNNCALIYIFCKYMYLNGVFLNFIFKSRNNHCIYLLYVTLSSNLYVI